VYARLESEGLIVRKRGSGTFVAQPRQTTRKSTGIIGLSGEGFSFNGYSSYWARLMSGVRGEAAAAEFQILLLDPESHNGWEKADGVLVCDWHALRIPRNHIADLPVVSLMTPVEGMASVVADEENGAQQATEKLIALGHRRIGFLYSYEESIIVLNRLAGYRKALRAAGVTPSKKWERFLYGQCFFGAEFTTGARISLEYWLREDWRALGLTALLCHNDESALGVIQALNEKGIRVPQDISVIGFDGTEFCEMVSPKLTSVELPLREIGATGVELLLQQIAADEVSDEHRVLPTQLQERESTAAPSHYS